MINDKITRQEGGENSTNLQGQSIIINQGITYQDAKNIAIDVFKSNFLELSEKAATIAKNRAEELVDDFLQKIQARQPEAINSMESPGMQYALYTAQKEYAKTGDKDLSDMLVDILVDRANQQERNLKQIVLDESLIIIPKLTNSQLDTLTVIFILRYTKNNNIMGLEFFAKYLLEYLAPFISNLSKENSLYQHIEFTGCGSIMQFGQPLEEILKVSYPAIFCKGFTKEEFELSGEKLEKYYGLITQCFRDRTKFQIIDWSDDVFEQIKTNLKLTLSDLNKLDPFKTNYQIDINEAKKFLLDQGDFMTLLFDVWENSSVQRMSLSSVGITIATANLRRKTGITVDLGIWIK